MKNRKIALTGCAFAFSMIAVFAHASTERAGLAACADAMISGIETSTGNLPGYRVDKRSSISSKKLNVQDAFHLDVRDQASGEVVAKADCIVNAHAEVLQLIELPLDSPDAKRRAIRL